MQILHIRALADRAVTLDLADRPGVTAAGIVAAAERAIAAAIRNDALPGAEEVAAAFCSVTVHYDNAVTAQADLVVALDALLAPVTPDAAAGGYLWHLPCCHDADLGPDLDDLARATGQSVAMIIAAHSAATLTVFALGFLPGLPFLGELPDSFARPRRTDPRKQVPAGSVAIANRMCVIYPWASPGGWHILGRCPVPLFDITRPVPALLAPGDRVRFVAVGRAEFDGVAAEVDAGRFDPLSCRTV